MARFLQDSLEELSKLKAVTDGVSKAAEFAKFVKAVRTEGAIVTTEDIMKFAKFFEDELTLDNLSTSQLRALCKVLNVSTFGSPEILRLQLNLKLNQLIADDRVSFHFIATLILGNLRRRWRGHACDF